MSAVLEPPKKPEPPMSKPMVPYLRFSKEFWDKINRGEVELGENKSRSAGVMSKLIASSWHELGEKGQRQYVEAYDRETELYTKVMAEWRESKEVLEYDVRLKKYQNAVKQRELEEKMKREQLAAAARTDAALAGYGMSTSVDLIHSYADGIDNSKPQTIGPAFAGGQTDSKPLARLDNVFERLTQNVKFPGEQWSQGVEDIADPAYSTHAAAKARYHRNDSYMQEIMCRVVDPKELEAAAEAPNPKVDSHLETLLLDAIKRTREEIDELAQPRVPKRVRAELNVKREGGSGAGPAAEGGAGGQGEGISGSADADETLVFRKLLPVGSVVPDAAVIDLAKRQLEEGSVATARARDADAVVSAAEAEPA